MQPIPEISELGHRVKDTQAFLRMAAIELRRIAEEAPDISASLRHMAQQLETEVEDLARWVSEPGSHPDSGAET